MRLAVYTDYVYVREGETVYAERAFSLFLAQLADRLGGLTLIGRLNPEPGRARYPLPEGSSFLALPYYERLSHPPAVLRASARSVRAFWRALDEVDAVWLLGPHPLSVVFAILGLIRGRKVFLGVRSDLPTYTRWRHPKNRLFQFAAWALDAVWRILSRRCPVIVVGPELRRRYSGAGRLLEITVSLVAQQDIAGETDAQARSYSGELTIVSVGRIAEEKNPLALADVLAALGEGPHDWRLLVCGEGPLEQALASRLSDLGVSDRADLRGYVPAADMRAIYDSAHFLLHTSWTEGLPQVLIEAFAAGLPVIATDVGGIREGVNGAARLVPPGDVAGAAAALRDLADDGSARDALVEQGLAYVREHTIEREIERVAGFIAEGSGS